MAGAHFSHVSRGLSKLKPHAGHAILSRSAELDPESSPTRVTDETPALLAGSTSTVVMAYECERPNA